MKIIFASLFALLVLPTSILAKVGGHCSNNWGEDCICLDKDVCRKTWGGIAYTGTPGNYPCPDDPKDIMACVIRPCPTQPKSGTTQCLWKEGCKSPSGSKCLLPIQRRCLFELQNNADFNNGRACLSRWEQFHLLQPQVFGLKPSLGRKWDWVFIRWLYADCVHQNCAERGTRREKFVG